MTCSGRAAFALPAFPLPVKDARDKAFWIIAFGLSDADEDCSTVIPFDDKDFKNF